MDVNEKLGSIKATPRGERLAAHAATTDACRERRLWWRLWKRNPRWAWPEMVRAHAAPVSLERERRRRERAEREARPELFLVARVNNQDLQGRIVQQGSRLVLGDHDGPHATHVFLCLRVGRGTPLLRLEGAAERAVFSAWYGECRCVTRFWRVPTTNKILDGFFWIAHELPTYDGLDLEWAVSCMSRAARENSPFPVRSGPLVDEALKESARGAFLVCDALGIEIPTLFPQEWVRVANARGWEAVSLEEVAL